MTRLRSDDRGVSELIGYVLAFSIVVASVGAVAAGGLGAAMEFQQDERETNAERAFVALAESLNDLQRGDAPARNGEIRLAEGTLSMAEGPSVTVAVDDGGGNVEVYEREVDALSYAVGDTRVAYVTGGVVREDDGAGSIAAGPPFACTDEQAIVSIVTLTGDANTRAGQGSVLIEAQRSSKRIVEANEGAESVSIRIGENSEAWQRHLTQGQWTASGDGVTCNTESVVVRETEVRIDFL